MGQTPRIFLLCTGFSGCFWLRNTQVSLGIMIVEFLLQEGSLIHSSLYRVELAPLLSDDGSKDLVVIQTQVQVPINQQGDLS